MLTWFPFTIKPITTESKFVVCVFKEVRVRSHVVCTMIGSDIVLEEEKSSIKVLIFGRRIHGLLGKDRKEKINWRNS